MDDPDDVGDIHMDSRTFSLPGGKIVSGMDEVKEPARFGRAGANLA
jgi:hypothetical protein